MNNFSIGRTRQWHNEVEQFWAEKENERLLIDLQKAQRDEIYKIEAERFFNEDNMLGHEISFADEDGKTQSESKNDSNDQKGFMHIGHTLAYIFNRKK